MLAEVVHLGYAETVLRRHGRARFVDAGCDILPGLVHRVVFDEERFAPAGDELHQPRVDAGKRCLHERPLPVEDRLALVLKVEDSRTGRHLRSCWPNRSPCAGFLV